MADESGIPNGGGQIPEGGQVEGGQAAAPEFNWKGSLPDEIRTSKSFDSYSDDISGLHNMAKSYVNAQSMIGRDKVVLPKPGDDQSVYDAYYDAIGRPKSAEEYKFEGAQYPEGMDDQFKSFMDEFSGSMFNQEELAKQFHELGLSNEQANKAFSAIYNQSMEAAYNQVMAASQEHDKAVAALKDEWGEKFDDRLALANRGLRRYADDSTYDSLESKGLLDDPDIARIFEKIGAESLEDKAAPHTEHLSIKEKSQRRLEEVNMSLLDPKVPQSNRQRLLQEKEDLHKILADGK